jgi:hypothetical protein
MYAGSAGVAARGEAQPFIKNESRSTVGWLDVQRFWLSRHENLLGHFSRRNSQISIAKLMVALHGRKQYYPS